MDAVWLVVAVAGLVILGASIAAARGPVIPPAEVRVFRLVNGLPDGLYRLVWLPMQLGNLVVGTLVGSAVAVHAGDAAVGSGVVVAATAKLAIERVVRRWVARRLAVRQRPGTSQVGAVLRGRDVPATGPSFPSGHVILVTVIGCVVTAMASATGAGPWVAAVLTALVMLGRVYVGAHNPLDVTAGLGTGLVVGGGLAVLVS